MAKLMAHLVAGYPTDDMAFLVAKSLILGGADILEIQLPFSDPSADGPAIQGACCDVLKSGYSTKQGLSLISKISSSFPTTTIYLMSYGSLVYTPGVQDFCKMAKKAGVSGLIIPDLPFDCDEGLKLACKENGLQDIPVAAPSMSPKRLKMLLDCGYKYIYAALRVGITGTNTIIDDSVTEFLKNVAKGKSKIYGGFGISTGQQAKKVAPLVEAVVAGSVFVRIINETKDDVAMLQQKIIQKAKELKSN